MSLAPEPSRTDIDRGRRLFAGDFAFLSAAGSIESLPRPSGLEVAFAGRSNVGKSSLINALTGRKMLARTSHTPGRTQELIFFRGPSPLVLVDLPGYGYAAAPKSKISRWTRLVQDYLSGRPALARVYLLLDARHGLKASDAPVLDALDRAAVSYQVVLTKCDHVDAAELAATGEAVREAMRKRPASFPALLATSAHAGTGIAELRAAIARLVAERAR